MVTNLEKAFSWLAFPVYAVQGLRVRSRIQRMLPPAASAVAEIEGKGQPIRTLMIGDSSAAGVGVTEFHQSVAGGFPALLAELTGRPVYARTCGNNSATTGQIRDYVLPHIEPLDYDYVVLSIGTNDAKNFHSGKRFCKEFGTLIYALRTRFPNARIIWSGIIDIGDIPALPFPLNRILSIRSRILMQAGKTLCEERGALAPPSGWQPLPENFAEDGFHCSAKGYGMWAKELAGFIAKMEISEATPKG